MSLVETIIDQLETWPDLASGRAACGHGRSFTADGAELLHLHGDAEAQVCLTAPVINRIGAQLRAAGVMTAGWGDWVTVPLDTPADATLVINLVSVAIKANTSAGPAHRPARTGCRFQLAGPNGAAGDIRDGLAATDPSGSG